MRNLLIGLLIGVAAAGGAVLLFWRSPRPPAESVSSTAPTPHSALVRPNRILAGPLQTPPSIDSLLADLGGTESERIQALVQLGDMGSAAAAATPLLIERIRKSDRPKWPAFIALSRIAAPKGVVVPFLASCYAESKPGTQDRAGVLAALALLRGEAKDEVGDRIEKDFAAAIDAHGPLDEAPANRFENAPAVRDSYNLAVALLSIHSASARAPQALDRITDGDCWPVSNEKRMVLDFAGDPQPYDEPGTALSKDDVQLYWKAEALRAAVGGVRGSAELRQRLALSLISSTPRLCALAGIPVRSFVAAAQAREHKEEADREAEAQVATARQLAMYEQIKRARARREEEEREYARKTGGYEPPVQPHDFEDYFQENILIPNNARPNRVIEQMKAQDAAKAADPRILDVRTAASRHLVLLVLRRFTVDQPNTDADLERAARNLANGRDTFNHPVAVIEAEGLLRPDEPTVTKVLIRCLDSNDDLERLRAAQALGRLGQAALRSGKKLQDSAQNDPVSEVRAAATWALERIGADSTSQ